MSEADDSTPPPPSGGRHRAPVDPRRRLLTRLVAPLTAVAVVVAVILVVIALNGHSSGNGPGPGVITAQVTPTVTASATDSVTPRSSASPKPSATRPQSPGSTAGSKHRSRHRNAKAPVRVLNNSRITGLAHHVASRLVAHGWNVTSVGNVLGTFAKTSLYYDAGLRDAARHLAREFPGIRRVKSNHAAGIHASGLTLIVTRDWRD